MRGEYSDIMDSEDIEVELFIQGMFFKYGYDFRDYSRAHMKRRIKNRLVLSDFDNISQMQHRMLTDELYFKSLLPGFSINVTNMFRDPEFFAYIRNEIIPILKTYPKVKIWHAGCSTGEEVYSMAIMLIEEGIYDRCTIYATDFNESILKVASQGIFGLDKVKEYTTNYINSKGKKDFFDYYTEKGSVAIMNQSLKKNIIFSQHNLVIDQVFGEMQIIICRNVFIYFNNQLQEKVTHLFYQSLCRGGILCLGSEETIKSLKARDEFEVYEEKQKIYRKKLSDRNYR